MSPPTEPAIRDADPYELEFYTKLRQAMAEPHSYDDDNIHGDLEDVCLRLMAHGMEDIDEADEALVQAALNERAAQEVATPSTTEPAIRIACIEPTTTPTPSCSFCLKPTGDGGVYVGSTANGAPLVRICVKCRVQLAQQCIGGAYYQEAFVQALKQHSAVQAAYASVGNPSADEEG